MGPSLQNLLQQSALLLLFGAKRPEGGCGLHWGGAKDFGPACCSLRSADCIQPEGETTKVSRCWYVSGIATLAAFFQVSQLLQLQLAELSKGERLLPFLGRERVVWRCRQHKGSNHVPLCSLLWEMLESTFYSYRSEVTYHKKDKPPSETINNIQKNKTTLWQGCLIQFGVQQDMTRPSEN